MALRTQPWTENATDLAAPKEYAVILHNDDFTTMEFVVGILIRIFHKTGQEAANIMMDVHNSGKAAAGAYTYDVAITKKIQSEQLASQQGFPLRLTLEEIIEG